ncbi:MAG: hypothetical protein QNL04_08390 [SAR324 cluster bacterium]|nr:hypothetical protein [SAR324 cluster bacterium]
MAAKLKILGLGFKLLSWKSLTSRIHNELIQQGGLVEFHLVPKGWGDFLMQSLRGYDDFKADIILISLPAFNNLQGFADFYNGLLLHEPKKLPSLWLVTKNYQETFTEILDKNPRSQLHVRNIGKISLNSPSQIKEKSASNELLQITPTPKFHLKGVDEATSKQISEGFIPADVVGKVIWQDQEFTGPEFFDFQAYLFEAEKPLLFSQGFLKSKGNIYLRGKINPREILSIKNPNLEIDQIVSFADLKLPNFIADIVGESKARLVQKWTEVEKNSLTYLKEFTPISIISHHKLAAKMIACSLRELGLKKTQVGSKSPYSLHVFLNNTEIGECPYFLDSSAEPLLVRILAMPDLGAAYFERLLPPQNLLSAAAIDEEKSKVKAQIHMLFERQKGLTGRKVMAEQEMGLIYESREKAQLLIILAQKIEVIEDVDLSLGEDALVFFDDPAVASSMSRMLTQGGGKSLFVDLSEIENMDALLEYDTHPLAHYCDQGRVYASRVSKRRLVTLMSNILDEIPLAHASEPQMAEQALELEGTALDQALDELSYLTLWNQVQDFTQIHLNEILDAAAKALPEIEKQIFKLERPNQVCLFSSQRLSEEKLRFLSLKLFGEKPALKFINLEYLLDGEDLKTDKPEHEEQKDVSEEEITNAEAAKNALTLKDFFEQATYDLVHVQPDFLLIELEMDLLLLLVEFLRKTSQLANTPIMALATGWISADSASRLVDLGVKITYEFSGDREYLSNRLLSTLEP